MIRSLLLLVLAAILIAIAGVYLGIIEPSQSGDSASAPAPDARGDAADRFIICPGNPRCPKGQDGQGNAQLDGQKQ